MTDQVRLELEPLGQKIFVPRGTALQEVLFAHGIEFPCGGRGRCRGCKVKVLAGSLPATRDQAQRLTAQEIDEGWRLACCCQATDNLKLELAQWEAPILADDTGFAFTPHLGLGAAVDLGTTTLAAQLLDRRTGHVLAVRTALNTQAQYGADIMSRVQFAMEDRGLHRLQDMIRQQVGQLIQDMLLASQRHAAELQEVVIVGNTVMHHLFCGISPEPLSRYPFESPHKGLQLFSASSLGWDWGDQFSVHFLPCLGGFVGSDILAGILATKLHQSSALSGLIDLGTNGEVVVGNRQRILCASTAAGPAFEGARISMGMRAVTGAIAEVQIKQGQLACRVLGQGPARGICGSGLVDAVAAGLELGWIQPSGRLAQKDTPIELCPTVKLTQGDIRELQLAKGAIAAAIRILLERWNVKPEDLACIYLAGAFGNYINRASARRIGIYQFSAEQVQPAGNTALRGAKLALFAPTTEALAYPELRQRIEHFSLSANPHFQEIFMEQMQFSKPWNSCETSLVSSL